MTSAESAMQIRFRWLPAAMLASGLLVASWAAGQQPPQPASVVPAEPPVGSAAAEEPPDSFTPSAEFQEWITRIVREQLPKDYEKKKNWGHQAKAFDGLSVQLKDGQLKTHRKFKMANDGKWSMYRVTLKDPEEKLEIRVAKIEQLAN